MAYRQSPQRTQGPSKTTRATHGSQCPCAVCTDLGSVSESITSPRGRQGGGSLASESCRSRGPQASTASRCTDDSTRNPSKGTHPSRNPAPEHSAGVSAAHVLDSECLSLTKMEDGKSKGGPPSCPPPDSQAGRGGEGGGMCLNVGSGKKPKRTASSTKKGKCKDVKELAGKGVGKGCGKEGDKEGEGSRAAPKPRPLCISDGRHGGNSQELEDECDFNEEEIGPEVPAEDQNLGESPPCGKDTDQTEAGTRAVASYLPQQSGAPAPSAKISCEPGSWAVKKADWSPLGPRPPVDRYAITRYGSPSDWYKRNVETFEKASGDVNLASLERFNAKACIEENVANSTRKQGGVTLSIQQRNADIRRWLPQYHRCYKALWKEIQGLAAEDDRLRRILAVLETISQIVNESIDLRTTRAEPDLIRDEVEIELNKELEVANDIRQLIERTREQIQPQLDCSRSAKHRIEQAIADKQQTTRIDCANANLRVDTPTILFYEDYDFYETPQYTENQFSLNDWEAFSGDTLKQCENEVAKIRSLRGMIEAIVREGGRNLLAQKAKVDDSIARNIELVSSVLQDLEDQLNRVLRSIVETEQTIRELRETIRKFDFPIKMAQTRLHNRQDRPRLENVRDCPQYGLIDELKSISGLADNVWNQMASAERALSTLNDTRRFLEREVEAKKKDIFIDRDRIQKIRLGYPSASAILTHPLALCLPCH